MAKTQANQALQVFWTPVFARGKLYIHVCDPAKAAKDPNYPVKLNDAEGLAKFVAHLLPEILETMKIRHHWATVPRVIVHDKASYMVTSAHERLHVAFAGALQSSGFTSWVGGPKHNDPTNWLCARLGDVYPHETVISHIRRLLDGEFLSTKLHETVPHFKQRMARVACFMNSKKFAAEGGTGLSGLAKELLPRAELLVKGQGERLPK